MSSLSNLSDLIKEKKLDEAQAVLNDIVSKPLSDKERGEALVKLAMIYVEVKNSIDKEFLEHFKEAMETVKNIKSAEQKIADQTKLADIRENLS